MEKQFMKIAVEKICEVQLRSGLVLACRPGSFQSDVEFEQVSWKDAHSESNFVFTTDEVAGIKYRNE